MKKGNQLGKPEEAYVGKGQMRTKGNNTNI